MSKVYVYSDGKSKICFDVELSDLSLRMSNLTYSLEDTILINENISYLRNNVNITPDNFYNITVNLISSYDNLEVLKKPLNELVEVYKKEDEWIEMGKRLAEIQFK